MDTPENYRYSHLPTGLTNQPFGQFIRILVLQPGSSDSDLKCELREEAIGGFRYDAVSYVWGNPEKVVPIQCNGKCLKITENLAETLRALRSRYDIRSLWADGICIDQDNETEREAQVGLMGPIYSSAERVHCWLGPDPGIGAAVQEGMMYFSKDPQSYIKSALQSTCQTSQLTNSSLRPLPNESNSMLQGDQSPFEFDWTAIKTFFDFAYFHRVWIIQEIGLAKQAILYLGDVRFLWEDIAKFVYTLDNDAPFIVTSRGLSSWVANHIHLIWRRAGFDMKYNFAEVLHWARVHQASDSRDRVFAFLGHPSAKINGTLIIHPNYHKSYTHLDAYRDVAKNLILATHSLRILSFVDHDIEPSEQDLPSWVPAWHITTKTNFLAYPASSAPATDSSIEVVSLGRHLALKVQGFIVDIISLQSDVLEITEFLVTDHNTECQKSTPFLLDHIWSALKCDELPDSVKLDSLDQLSVVLACDWINSKHVTENIWEHRLNFAEYIYQFDRIRKDEPAVILTSLAENDLNTLLSRRKYGRSSQFVQFMGTCHARRVFRSTNDKFGTGPRVAKPGDACCVVFGARLPLVLRQKGLHWEFVGECVLEGVMNSEAMRLYEKGELQLREFSII